MADPVDPNSPFAEPPEATEAMEVAHQEIRDVAGDPLDAVYQDEVAGAKEEVSIVSDSRQVPSGAGTMSEADEQMWSVLAHASGLVGLVGPPSFLGPLFVYLMKKNESPRVRANAAEALNFHITMAIAAIVAAISIIILVGIILLPAVMLAWLVFTIMGAVKTSNGEDYRYPINLRMVS